MNNKRILVVEDEAVVAQDITTILTNIGYTVTSVLNSGQDAVEQAGRDLPDLVLMDVILKGGIDGIETAEIIHSRFDVPVVYLTAHSDKNTQERARKTSPFGFIVKPFKPKDLEVAIEMALFRHNVNRQMFHYNTILEILNRISLKGQKMRSPSSFAKVACDLMTAPQGYAKCWITLIDENQKIQSSSQAGFGEANGFFKRIRKGLSLPQCYRKALSRSQIVVEKKDSSDCFECELLNCNNNGMTMISRLKSGRITYGVLCAVTEMGLLEKEKEKALFQELARVVTNALHDMKVNQKQNEIKKALEESEARYRLLVETSRDGIAIVDSNENLAFLNQSYADNLEYTKSELLGKNLKEITDSQEFERYRVLTDKRKKGLSNQYETKLLAKSGVIKDFSVSASPFYDGNQKFLGTLAILSDITERMQAAEHLKQSILKLNMVLVETIHAMSLIVETRDPYTAGHQRRVANLAGAIGLEMGLDKERIHGLRLTGEIHDIGKIHIPSEILSKPGRLNDNEFSLIKNHSQVGYDILKEIEFPWPIAVIVLQHHERMDGSGYPAGIMGDEILLESRIIAVADVLEAMSSHRPYRPSLGLDKALEEIKRGSGLCYDETVVEACVSLLEKKNFNLDEEYNSTFLFTADSSRPS